MQSPSKVTAAQQKAPLPPSVVATSLTLCVTRAAAVTARATMTSPPRHHHHNGTVAVAEARGAWRPGHVREWLQQKGRWRSSGRERSGAASSVEAMSSRLA